MSSRRRLSWIERELDRLTAEQLRRQLNTHDGPQGPRLRFDERELINFGSNDYLALAADERLAAAVRDSIQSEGWGAGASPLVTGHSASHARLEQALAEFMGTEAALLFSSGFAANVGAIAALVGRDDVVFGDAKNHASLIDGCRLSRAAVHVYPHADVAALETMLQSASAYRRRLIVTDSVFSMDGDLAPLVELANLAEHYDAMLMVDEAHATGVLGKSGRGLAELLGVEQHVDVHVGTLSKALGSVGGFVAGSRALVDWLTNRARSYVFSTASPPAASAASLAALRIVADEPWRRTELLSKAQRLRDRLRGEGWNVGDSSSQILPVFIGDPGATMELSAKLRNLGLWVPGIRPPSVPPGESLLRISLSFGHTDEMLDRLQLPR